MIVMAIDHVRDFFHAGALHGQNPVDFATTTPALFLTRWITHFCAPNFSLAKPKIPAWAPKPMQWTLNPQLVN